MRPPPDTSAAKESTRTYNATNRCLEIGGLSITELATIRSSAAIARDTDARRDFAAMYSREEWSLSHIGELLALFARAVRKGWRLGLRS